MATPSAKGGMAPGSWLFPHTYLLETGGVFLDLAGHARCDSLS